VGPTVAVVGLSTAAGGPKQHEASLRSAGRVQGVRAAGAEVRPFSFWSWDSAQPDSVTRLPLAELSGGSPALG
jgi:hypothetical protein